MIANELFCPTFVLECIVQYFNCDETRGIQLYCNIQQVFMGTCSNSPHKPHHNHKVNSSSYHPAKYATIDKNIYDDPAQDPSKSRLNISKTQKTQHKPPRSKQHKGPFHKGTNTDSAITSYKVVNACINCAIEMKDSGVAESIRKSSLANSQREKSALRPSLFCPTNAPIVNVCISPKCENHPLYCNTVNCDVCLDNHSGCPAIPFNVLSRQILRRKEEHQDFLKKAQEIEAMALQNINTNRMRVPEKFDLGDVPAEELETIEKIYLEGAHDNGLDGQQTFNLEKELKAPRQERLENHEKILNEYHRVLEDIRKEFERAKENLHRAYEVGELVHVFPYHDSKITSLSRRSSQFFVKCLENPDKIQLIFRASENNFSAAAFHEKCDNKPNILVLVQTEYGKVIGGFSATPFVGSKNKYRSDRTGRSFVFSLNLMEMFPLMDQQKAIYCYEGNGPHFGGGDLYICDRCNTERNSECNMPCYYGSSEKYENSQVTWTAMTGSPVGNRFKVVEYEVYQVTYEEE